VLLLLLMSL
ncbi:hypothetical protein AVEN_272627-1, partial [Araneus ventricosus]